MTTRPAGLDRRYQSHFDCTAAHSSVSKVVPGRLASHARTWQSAYFKEGMRMDEHPFIVFRDGPMGRRPGLAGSRLDVWQIVTTVGANGSAQEAAAYLEIPIERALADMRYYAEYSDEIDGLTGKRLSPAASRRPGGIRQAWLGEADSGEL